ncbi:TonB-dependent receptor [Elusimicrobiota bacterium]
MYFVRYYVLLFLSFFILNLKVFGEDSVIKLQIIKSGTKTEKDIKKLPNSASLIDSNDIEMSNARAVTDVLENLPGIFIKKTSALGRADVNIRGIGDKGRQIGVFIDGRPDKMGIFGCSVTQSLPMNNIEKMEIIRGPESVLYGSEAFGGVVNIVTKRAKEKLEGSFKASAGTYNSQNYRFQLGSKINKLDYYISADKSSTDGHIENSGYNANDLSGQIGYKLSEKSDLSISGKNFNGIKYEPVPSASFSWNDYDRGSLDVTYTKTCSGSKSFIKGYRSFGEHEFSDGWHSKDYTNGLMLHSMMNILRSNELSMGLDYRYQWGKVLGGAPVLGEYNKYEYGMYVNDEHTFFDKMTIVGGLRYNHDEYAGDITVPKVGIVYNTLQKTIIRGIVSQGFRAPQINDLYLFSSANSDLKSEKIWNHEVGIKHEISKATNIDIAGYVMKGEDMIEIRSGKKQNIGEFEFRGFETSFNTKINNRMSGSINYSFLDPGEKTSGRPGDQIGVELKYDNDKIDGIIYGEYVGSYYANDNSANKIDDYIVLNTKLIYNLSKDLDIFAEVNNILNEQYEILNDNGLYKMPGAALNIGVKHNF